MSIAIRPTYTLTHHKWPIEKNSVVENERKLNKFSPGEAMAALAFWQQAKMIVSAFSKCCKQLSKYSANITIFFIFALPRYRHRMERNGANDDDCVVSSSSFGYDFIIIYELNASCTKPKMSVGFHAKCEIVIIIVIGRTSYAHSPADGVWCVFIKYMGNDDGCYDKMSAINKCGVLESGGKFCENWRCQGCCRLKIAYFISLSYLCDDARHSSSFFLPM